VPMIRNLLTENGARGGAGEEASESKKEERSRTR
jgi:hypothetical protein